MAFYEVFESLCKERGISPTRAARDNGLKQQSVSSWKTRGSTPKAETVQKLADYFGVSVDYLLGLTNAPDRGPLGDGNGYGGPADKTPAPEGRREVQRNDLMAAFWDGADPNITPEEWEDMWKDVERFAAFVLQKKQEEKRKAPPDAAEGRKQ